MDTTDFYKNVATAQDRTTGKWGVVNNLGAPIGNMGMEFDWLGSFENDRAFFAVAGDDLKFGYINMSGDTVIQPIYSDVGNFSQSRAAVQDFETGKWGFINTNGGTVLAPGYDGVSDFERGFAIISTGMGGDRKVGLVNSSGRVVVPCEYRSIKIPSQGFAAAQDFNTGKWGYVRVSGSRAGRALSLPFSFDTAEPFREGLARVRVGSRWGFLKTNGKTVSGGYKYGGAGDFSGNFAPVQDPNTNKWGFINKDGKVVVSYMYDNARSFSFGLAPVALGGRWGFVNSSGKLIVQCTYGSVGDFVDGRAWVRDAATNKYGFVNPQGNLAVDLIFSTVFDQNFSAHRDGFSRGLARVRIDNENWGLIGRNGTVHLTNAYTRISRIDSSSNYVWIYEADDFGAVKLGIVRLNLPSSFTKAPAAHPTANSSLDNAQQRGTGRILPGNSRKVAIGDALEVLKFLAGMKGPIKDGGKNSRAYQASLITPACKKAGKPTIGAALEILKKLAGMKSLVK